MPWTDLQAGILEEFTDAAARADLGLGLYADGIRWRNPPSKQPDYAREYQRVYYKTVRCRSDVRAKEIAAQKAKRMAHRDRRTAEAAQARCANPKCANPPRPAGPTAKIPTYCSKKCSRAVRWARWAAKRSAS